jgi:hypothetical protein
MTPLLVLRLSLATALIVAVSLMTSGCPPVTLKTIVLPPSNMAVGVSGTQGTTGCFYCPGQNIPPTSFSAGQNQAMVGFDDYYQPGSGLCPCNDVRAVVFRSGVMFDLSKFDSIVSADLLFDTVNSVSRSNGETTGQSPPASYATTLGVGTQAFSAAMPDDNEVSIGQTSGSVDLGVSSQVRDWISGAHPNFGFVLWGPTSPPDQNSFPTDNNAQVSWYSNIRLQVVYNPAHNSRVPQ